MVGKKLGHYETLEPLGAGGMSVLFLGRDARINVILNWFEELKERVPTGR